MPELPEVETVCRSLKRLAGKTIRAVQVFRPRTVAPLSVREFTHRLRGARIVRVNRRAKYLVFHLASNSRLAGHPILLVHLRMTGNLYMEDGESELYPANSLEKPTAKKAFAAATPALVFQLAGRKRMVLDDPRGLAVCQLLTEAGANSRLAQLGPEPVSPRFTGRRLFEMTRGSRSPIKVFLMDQRRIAGLGNIYSAEALYRAGIHPLLPAGRLTRPAAGRLQRAIVRVLRDAVQSALRGYRGPRGFGPEELFAPQVYSREGEPCHRCGEVIRRLVLQSRSAFYCPQCQSEPRP